MREWAIDRDVNRDVDAVGAGRVAAVSFEHSGGNFLRGWAESAEPGRPVYLGVVWGGAVVALAVADKFDQRAFDERRGSGWIGFRLPLDDVPDLAPGDRVNVMCLKSGERVHAHEMVRPDDWRRTRRVRRTVHELVTEGSADQVGFELAQIEYYVREYVDAHNIDDFITVSYRYLLRREADIEGIVAYKQRFVGGLDFMDFLKEMVNSEEFSRLKKLPNSLPGHLSFPYH